MNNTEVLLREIMLQTPHKIKQAFDYDVTTGDSEKIEYSRNVIPKIEYILNNYEYTVEDDLDGIPPSIIIHYGIVTERALIIHIKF